MLQIHYKLDTPSNQKTFGPIQLFFKDTIKIYQNDVLCCASSPNSIELATLPISRRFTSLVSHSHMVFSLFTTHKPAVASPFPSHYFECIFNSRIINIVPKQKRERPVQSAHQRKKISTKIPKPTKRPTTTSRVLPASCLFFQPIFQYSRSCLCVFHHRAP